jgi:RNA polymerase sigma factor (sigma-70 family)
MKEKWIEFINGNDLALARLYEDLFQPLLFVSIKYTHDLEISRDIISELFTTLLETSLEDRSVKWKEVREIKAFLIILIRNKSIDAIRTRTNRSKLCNDWIKNQKTETEIGYIIEEYTEQCLSHLNKDEKSLILLHLEGYKNQEIGKKFNYSEKTVRNKLSLSRKKLVYIWKNLIILIVWKILN